MTENPEHDPDAWVDRPPVSTTRGCLYGLGCLVGAALGFVVIVAATALLWGSGSAFHTVP